MMESAKTTVMVQFVGGPKDGEQSMPIPLKGFIQFMVRRHQAMEIQPIGSLPAVPPCSDFVTHSYYLRRGRYLHESLL